MQSVLLRAWFFCPQRLRDFFFVPIGCMIFCHERLRDIFIPKSLCDFFFPRGCVIFLLSRKVVWFFFCPNGLHDFLFVPRGCEIFLLTRGCGIFGLKRLRDYFCPKRLLFLSWEVAWFFVLRWGMIFFVPRGLVIFLSQEFE